MGLTVENLTKRFGEKTAIHHLNFVMEEPGSIWTAGNQWCRENHNHTQHSGYYAAG